MYMCWYRMSCTCCNIHVTPYIMLDRHYCMSMYVCTYIVSLGVCVGV